MIWNLHDYFWIVIFQAEERRLELELGIVEAKPAKISKKEQAEKDKEKDKQGKRMRLTRAVRSKYTGPGSAAEKEGKVPKKK